MCADFGADGCPGGPDLNLSSVALLGKLAESGRQDFGGGAGCRGVFGTAGAKSVYQPRPGNVGKKRVDPNIGLERSLRETDDAEGAAAPRFGLGRIVKEDKAPGSEDGIVRVSERCHIGSKGDGVRREVSGRRNLAEGQLGSDVGTTHGGERRAEGGRFRRSCQSLGHE